MGFESLSAMSDKIKTNLAETTNDEFYSCPASVKITVKNAAQNAKFITNFHIDKTGKKTHENLKMC